MLIVRRCRSGQMMSTPVTCVQDKWYIADPKCKILHGENCSLTHSKQFAALQQFILLMWRICLSFFFPLNCLGFNYKAHVQACCTATKAGLFLLEQQMHGDYLHDFFLIKFLAASIELVDLCFNWIQWKSVFWQRHVCYATLFFFFKEEDRIEDLVWSSDVFVAIALTECSCLNVCGR